GVDSSKRFLDLLEQILADGRLCKIVVESFKVRLFERRTQRNGGLGSQLLRFVAIGHDRQQQIADGVVHHHEISREIGGDDPVGYGTSAVAENLDEHLSGV